MPVATTRPRARPFVTVVPLKPRFTRSPSASLSPVSASVRFSTVTDSPVSVDSSTFSCAASSRRRSAGIWLPASSSTMSPGTRLLAATGCDWPPRSTCACAAASWRSAAIAWSARRAWLKPITAFSSTMTTITRVSMRSPTSPDTMAAASSTRIMKSLNWSSSSAHQGRSVCVASSLAPCCCRRRAASSALRPLAASLCRACSRCSRRAASSALRPLAASLCRACSASAVLRRCHSGAAGSGVEAGSVMYFAGSGVSHCAQRA